ncbi:hypothetical protein [Streptomyces sp. NPDC014685]|uniref:hypothetical protein n=1 Tax=Streptomyces sp. NPDC014685 TaxID=3364881 RepID=UPI0036FC2A35
MSLSSLAWAGASSAANSPVSRARETVDFESWKPSSTFHLIPAILTRSVRGQGWSLGAWAEKYAISLGSAMERRMSSHRRGWSVAIQAQS